MMKSPIRTLKRVTLPWALGLMLFSGFALAVTGCRDNDDLEDATEEAGEAIEEGADNIGDAAEDATR